MPSWSMICSLMVKTRTWSMGMGSAAATAATETATHAHAPMLRPVLDRFAIMVPPPATMLGDHQGRNMRRSASACHEMALAGMGHFARSAYIP